MLHPHLSKVPEDAPDGLDSPLPPPPPIDWSKSGNVFPVTKDEKDEGEENSDNGEQPEDTWQDWALCMGAEIMAEVREQVWKRLHYTCSAGIAHSKAMSKVRLVVDYAKLSAVLRLEETVCPDRAPYGGGTWVSAGHGLHRCSYSSRNAQLINRFVSSEGSSEMRLQKSSRPRLWATCCESPPYTQLTGRMVSLEDMQAKFGEESIWVYNILRVSCYLALPLTPAGSRPHGSQGKAIHKIDAGVQEHYPECAHSGTRASLAVRFGGRAACPIARSKTSDTQSVAQDDRHVYPQWLGTVPISPSSFPLHAQSYPGVHPQARTQAVG